MTISPEFFGKYILLEKLATGGMAEVYLAKLTGAENVAKYVAIKRILPQFSQNQEFIEMFKEEAKIAVNLAHSNVVPIYEFGEQNGQFYIVMEYVEGRNLRQILNRLGKTSLRLSLDQIIYIVNEAARGLDHAHRSVDGTTGRPLNITHRDMSPQNVMISFEGEVKIVDFGIAKAESKIENTKAGTLKGKFGYMSPEQADGLEVDFRTDIFSLGIVLWELISNERLFISNNEINTLRKIRDCIVPSLRKLDPNIPVEVERIVNKALARDRNLRYQSAGDFHRDLSRFLNRQFPDFTSQDFSTFIKTIFEREREESRQKMIEYAKIQSTVNDKTQFIDVTNTITETNTTQKNVQKKPEEAQIQNLIPSDQVKSTEKIDLDVKFKRKDLLKQTLVTKSAPSSEPSVITTTGGLRGLPPLGRNTSYTATSHRETRLTGFWIAVLVIGLLGGGLYFTGFSSLTKFEFSQLSQFSEKFKNEFFAEDQPATTPEKGQTASASLDPGIPETPPAPSKYRVLITSTPSDAEISIDGVPFATPTPAQVEVPSNKPTKIILTRKGYAPYEGELIATSEGQEYRGLLTKRREAYINVSARPGSPIIYINKKPVSHTGSVKEYVITPDVEVLIQAYDKITQAQDVRRVTVKENAVVSIELFLRKPNASAQKRSTSGTSDK